MNSNNRLASLIIVALVTVGVPGLGYWFYLEPLWSLDSAMDGLSLELERQPRNRKTETAFASGFSRIIQGLNSGKK